MRRAPPLRIGDPTPPTSHRVESRVVDAAGRGVAGAAVALWVTRPDGTTTRISTGTAEDGCVTLLWPEGALLTRIAVETDRAAAHQTVVVRDDPAGVDLAGLDRISLDDLAYLPVLTVDPWREVRPAQRILFRARFGDEPLHGWWGETSDARGRLLLGPFARGTTIEIRPGPRGISSASIHDPGAWQQVLVDGSPVEVVVSGRPRLRLRFPDLEPGRRVPVAVIDERNGEVVTSANHVVGGAPFALPALADDLRIGLWVGPLDDGRVQHLADVVPTEEPIDVRLQPGRPVSGHVTVSEPLGVHGRVGAYAGHLLLGTAPLDDALRFSFPGLPEHRVDLVAETWPADGSGEREKGWAVAREDGDVEIPVAPLLRVEGSIVESIDGALRPTRSLARVCVSSDDPPLAVQGPRGRSGDRLGLALLPGRWRVEVETDDGRAHASVDLGDVRHDRNDVVVVLRR